jgi:CRISPR-associated protein Cmr2
VQGFIGAARRTRDLWYGSRLLSDLSRELATSLAALPGAWPIFPAPDALRPARAHLLQAPVSNKIVVCLQAQAGADCAAVAKALRDSLHALLRRVGVRCLRQLGWRGRQAVDAAAFRAQWSDALSLYCAWASFAEPGGRSYAGGL